MTDIYTAIMAAADQVEHYPESFDFGCIEKPSAPCGSPGCALGWIGYFLQLPESPSPISFYFRDPQCYIQKVAKRLGYNDDLDFYHRLDNLLPPRQGAASWVIDARLCAQALRLYAAKYHAPKLPLPERITAIFKFAQPKELA